jgi:hypothetical protein
MGRRSGTQKSTGTPSWTALARLQPLTLAMHLIQMYRKIGCRSSMICALPVLMIITSVHSVILKYRDNNIDTSSLIKRSPYSKVADKHDILLI